MLVALSLTAAPARADTPLPGYRLASQPSPVPYAVVCSLPSGDVVTFDGASVDRWTADGNPVAHLATLPAFVFPSFVIATPDGRSVVLGESSNGDLLLVHADGSGIAPLVQLPFNYDAAWLPSGDLVVSAATGGFGAGNELYRVQLSPPSATWLGHVSGASGPVAVSAGGALYYATVSDQFPPPVASTDVLRWTPDLVQAGALSEQNAQTLATGFEGASSLAIDPVTGRLFLAETNYSISLYQIVRVGPSAAASPRVVEQGLSFISDLEILPGGGPLGSLDPWQPDDGLMLRYNAGAELSTVRPARPVLTATGPGTTGPGPIDFTITGGVPNGRMAALLCPRASLLPQPIAHQLPTFLLVSSFELSDTRRASLALPLDSNGNGAFKLQNPGNLQGKFGWQILVGDATGIYLGSTNEVKF